MRNYHSPEIEIVKLQTEDIILASPGNGGNFGGGGSELPVIPRVTADGEVVGGNSGYGINSYDVSNAFSSGDIFGNR